MKLKAFAEWLTADLTALDHDELTVVQDISKGAGSETEPHNHNIVRVEHANGAVSTVQVYRVTGPGIPASADYRVPREAW
ncbi:hypothetical protein [Actinokineospora inagensis]|uniref:hypothetical protein n=1 Tax=Actinokineospora inagensis TaxID=103730 RepID=UPI0004026391|nr:hypothetical protein [Actinokineospora inagensis]